MKKTENRLRREISHSDWGKTDENFFFPFHHVTFLCVPSSKFEINKTTLWFHNVSNPESGWAACSLFIVLTWKQKEKFSLIFFTFCKYSLARCNDYLFCYIFQWNLIIFTSPNNKKCHLFQESLSCYRCIFQQNKKEIFKI